MAIFEAINIEKKFGKHTALENISLSIPEGAIYGLLGPNGAGKTTMLRIMNQIMIPDKGQLLFKNRKLNLNDLKDIGYLPEERGLYKKMKVGEQTMYFAQLKGLSKSEAKKNIGFWFEKFNITNWWNRKTEELSKGMQQKIQFIITVLHNPQFLIFDEPFTGFDPVNTNILKKEILRLKKEGTTIILSTHNMNSVEELCDNITLINHAKSIAEGPIDKIKEQHKSNIYEIIYKDMPEKPENIFQGNYKIIHSELKNSTRVIHVKSPGEETFRMLLSGIPDNIHILSFREVIPSMNDIFLKLVE